MKKNVTFSSLCLFLFLGGCSAPPLNYYTFSMENGKQAVNKITNYSTSTPVLIVTPVTIPDYLDTTDIITRNGHDLHHSINGRMSSVLSVAITDFITQSLSDKNPTLLITNQKQVGNPNRQILVNISKFDIEQQPDKTGSGILEANWSIIPTDEHKAIYKQKAAFTIQGSITSDSDVIKLEQALLTQLANQINGTILY